MPDIPLSADQILGYLGEVAQELAPAGPRHRIVVVGGSLLALHGLRQSTLDVDTVRRIEQELRDAVEQVARVHGLAPAWLNDSSAPFCPQTFVEQDCDVLLDQGRLLVLGAPLRQVFLMKLLVQFGLALYPGMTMPLGMRSPGPNQTPATAMEATPNGTLLLFLDRPGASATAFADKALRYGWPADAAYLPTLVAVGPDGPSDLAGTDAQRLQVALAAVVALDSRGLALAEAAPVMTGRVALADGARGDFVITQRPPLA